MLRESDALWSVFSWYSVDRNERNAQQHWRSPSVFARRCLHQRLSTGLYFC